MTSANLTQVILFFVILVIASATSHPFRSRSKGMVASRHGGFEWNARRVGSRRVATISIRKDEERDRRSIALADDDDDDTQIHHTSHHSHQHHHLGHHPQDGDGSSPDSRHSIRSVPHHRHHHGEGVEDLGMPTEEGEERVAVGNREERIEYEEEDLWEESDEGADEKVLDSSERALVLSETRTSDAADANKMLEFLSTVGVDPKVLRNYTQVLERRREKKEAKSERSKKKKRSKKVKRERKRKKNKGKKKKGRGRRKKCRGLKGKAKKQCRAEAQRSRQAPTPPPEPPIKLSGSDACQFKNLEECSRKVGLLEPHGSQRTVVKCNNREKFFDCMEEQRTEACNPSFEIEGNVKALRKQIRDAIHTTNSCLISEVIEG